MLGGGENVGVGDGRNYDARGDHQNGGALNGIKLDMSDLYQSYAEQVAKTKGYPYKILTAYTERSLEMLEKKFN